MLEMAKSRGMKMPGFAALTQLAVMFQVIKME